MAGGASGPEAFTILLRMLMTHFDGVATLDCEKYGFCNGTPFFISVGSFAYLCRPQRGVTMSCLQGRMWCWRWFGWRQMSNFRLMPAMYPGSMATDPLPHASLDAISRATSDWAHNKTLAVNGETFFLCPFFRRECGHPPRRCPGSPVMGAARAEYRPSHFRGRRDQAMIQLLCPSMILLTLDLTTHRTAGH